MKKLSAWCRKNKLQLNTSKTKELILDFRRKQEVDMTSLINSQLDEGPSRVSLPALQALTRQCQSSVCIFKAAKKKQPEEDTVGVVCSALHRILMYCLSVWYVSCTPADKNVYSI
ncbi:hypothetical protein ATANTOWER_011796 [Ataeniobius toweri]|uniref:Reverse transcriptase domain-containing protein n=1 Tax=Ataeniobius toweri TaxID=208326 RepID=A0ABU7AS75_9TELE|nr:hypothetical protein [Ataeniobius toweri]